jgi:hypothetical protein
MNKSTTEYKKALKRLTVAVIVFSNEMDKEMLKPSTAERGRRIAGWMNLLTIENQVAMRYTFGYSFKKIKKLYEMSKQEDKNK